MTVQRVVQGDITTLAVDAIVNAANQHLGGGSRWELVLESTEPFIEQLVRDCCRSVDNWAVAPWGRDWIGSRRPEDRCVNPGSHLLLLLAD